MIPTARDTDSPRQVHERQRVKRPFHKVHAAIHVAAGGMEHAPPVGEG